MNGHRTAVVALLAAARAEYAPSAGITRERLADRIAALESALVAGDEAEHADDDDDEWRVDVRAGVEARFEIDALRRSLARALGRRMTTRPVFGTGPDVDLPPPADAVLLSEVDALLRTGREYEAMRTDLRDALGLPRGTTGPRALAVLRERLAPADTTDTPRED